MTDKFDISDLMKNAKKIQEVMQKAQDELAKVHVTGESGAGLVKMIITAKHDIVKIDLADELLQESKEIMEELIKAAFNDANQKIIKKTQEKMMSNVNLFRDADNEDKNH